MEKLWFNFGNFGKKTFIPPFRARKTFIRPNWAPKLLYPVGKIEMQGPWAEPGGSPSQAWRAAETVPKLGNHVGYFENLCIFCKLWKKLWINFGLASGTHGTNTLRPNSCEDSGIVLGGLKITPNVAESLVCSQSRTSSGGTQDLGKAKTRQGVSCTVEHSTSTHSELLPTSRKLMGCKCLANHLILVRSDHTTRSLRAAPHIKLIQVRLGW